MPRRASSVKALKGRNRIAQGDALGALANNAPSPEGAEQGELPEGWRPSPLRDVVLKSEQTDPRTHPDREFRYIDVSSISRETLSIVRTSGMRGSEAPSRARKLIKAGDVIFATVRPSLRRVASVPPELDGQVCSTAFCVIRANPTLADPGFLFFATALEEFVKRVSEHQRGSSYPAVTDGQVLNQWLSLPPVPEQRAIGDVLRMLQRAKEATERVMAATRQLKASLMKHLFTYGPVPSGRVDRVAVEQTPYGLVRDDWPRVPIGRCASVQTGVAKGRKLDGDKVIEVPYLRVANVQSGHLDLTEMKTIQLRQREFPRYLLQDGDVVLTEGGDFDKLGRGFIWRNPISPCVHQNHIFAVRVDRAKLLPEFLAYLVQSAYGRAYFLSVAHKTTNLACINKTKLEHFPVILPSLHEQQQIAEQLSTVDTKMAVAERRLMALDALFKSLLHHLMTGKLRLPGYAGANV